MISRRSWNRPWLRGLLLGLWTAGLALRLADPAAFNSTIFLAIMAFGVLVGGAEAWFRLFRRPLTDPFEGDGTPRNDRAPRRWKTDLVVLASVLALGFLNLGDITFLVISFVGIPLLALDLAGARFGWLMGRR